jgi:hypothetical protein
VFLLLTRSLLGALQRYSRLDCILWAFDSAYFGGRASFLHEQQMLGGFALRIGRRKVCVFVIFKNAYTQTRIKTRMKNGRCFDYGFVFDLVFTLCCCCVVLD